MKAVPKRAHENGCRIFNFITEDRQCTYEYDPNENQDKYILHKPLPLFVLFG